MSSLSLWIFWVYSKNKDKCGLNRKWWMKLLLPSDPSSQGVAGEGTIAGWALRRIEASPWRAEGTAWKNLNYSSEGGCEWTLPAHCHVSLKLFNFKICGSHSNANAWPSALSLKINDIKNQQEHAAGHVTLITAIMRFLGVITQVVPRTSICWRTEDC